MTGKNAFSASPLRGLTIVTCPQNVILFLHAQARKTRTNVRPDSVVKAVELIQTRNAAGYHNRIYKEWPPVRWTPVQKLSSGQRLFVT